MMASTPSGGLRLSHCSCLLLEELGVEFALEVSHPSTPVKLPIDSGLQTGEQ